MPHRKLAGETFFSFSTDRMPFDPKCVSLLKGRHAFSKDKEAKNEPDLIVRLALSS